MNVAIGKPRCNEKTLRIEGLDGRQVFKGTDFSLMNGNRMPEDFSREDVNGPSDADYEIAGFSPSEDFHISTDCADEASKSIPVSGCAL